MGTSLVGSILIIHQCAGMEPLTSFALVVGGGWGAERGSMATGTAVSGPQRLHWESPIINHGGDGGGGSGWGCVCVIFKSHK